MTYLDGSLGTKGVHNAGQTQQTQQDTQQVGKKPIGDQIASFFSAIGKAIAAPFKALGNAISSLFSHKEPQGTTGTQDVTTPKLEKVKVSDTYSTQEKQQLMEEALNSSFYKSLQNSTSSMITEHNFRVAAESLLNTPESVKAMKQHGVSLTEAVAISMYTSQAYKVINDQIRSGNETPEVTQLKNNFVSGLDKLPSFEGTVYRGAHLPKDVGLQYQEGAMVMETGIMSTTWSKDEAFRNINYSITLQLKDGSSGKDISMFSDKPTECEVAFPPGTQLFVANREMSGRPEYSHMHPPDIGGQPCGVVDLILREV